MMESFPTKRKFYQPYPRNSRNGSCPIASSSARCHLRQQGKSTRSNCANAMVMSTRLEGTGPDGSAAITARREACHRKLKPIADRKSVVNGKSGTVRLDHGGGRRIKKKN